MPERKTFTVFGGARGGDVITISVELHDTHVQLAHLPEMAYPDDLFPRVLRDLYRISGDRLLFEKTLS